ncbi:TatD family hydrolase [Patescibacteria group bacterium]
MLIDSHCHIPHKKYEKNADEIVNEAKNEGVEKIISIGTSIQDSKDVLEATKPYENVYATIGVYPHEDLDKSLDEIREELENLLKNNRERIVGIGECGIDIVDGESVDYETRDLEEQKELFKLQIGLAIQYDLPIVIHNRDGDEEILNILRLYKEAKLRGVVHCYTSDWEFAKDLLHLDFYISFSAIITYPSAGEGLLLAVKNVMRDRLLVETDAPYLAPQGHRGEINYPKYVKITAAKVAQIRNSTLEEIEKYTYQNTCQLFNI